MDVTNANVKNVSFIRARDPSILAWNRPALNPAIRVALCDELSSVSTSLATEKESIVQTNDHIQVYLRIKPSNCLQELYDIKEDKILLCRVPEGSQAVRKLKDGEKIYKKYTFSKIYGPETRQDELFNDSVKEKVLDFINGKNCTLFTYGPSGAGKTFTILGEANNPGVIPRALEYIFRTLQTVEELPTVKPMSSGGVMMLDKLSGRQEQNLKHSILNVSLNSTDRTAHIKTYHTMQQRLSNEPSGSLVEDFSHISCGVWVSFAEVYNEYVYDLLQPEPPRGRLRAKLPLGLDGNGQTYIKNLSNISVSSGLEAYEILQYGMHNLNYANTAINSHSSRSHCIFTIKLVQASACGSEVQISKFNLCDLAGSERIKNSCSVGDRLKESSNINTSLHVLGRCIKSIRQQQRNNDSRLIPFRESKLTQLFQPALSGHEAIAMIVNMNPDRKMFDESQHVLNFSAIAKDISVEAAPKPLKIQIKNRFSQYMETHKLPLTNIEEDETAHDDASILRDQIQVLCHKLESERNAFNEREMMVRRELVEEFQKQLEQLNGSWHRRMSAVKANAKEQYENTITDIENYYRNVIAEASRRPKIASIIDLTTTDETTNESLNYEAENTKLQMEMKLKDKEIAALKQECHRLRSEEVSKKATQLEKILEDARIQYLELEKEKDDIEKRLDEQILENYNLQKDVVDLTEQLSAQTVDQLEKVEYVEQLEERLNRTLAELDDD